MFTAATSSPARLSALLAALWLTACGGGGTADTTATAGSALSTASVTAAPAGTGTTATPAPASQPAAAVVPVSALRTQMEPNTTYRVEATSAGTRVLVLPASPAVGDTVAIAPGFGARWRIEQNAGQRVWTNGLDGAGGSTQTALGTDGSIAGPATAAIALEYQGEGNFIVRSWSGGPFEVDVPYGAADCPTAACMRQYGG